ncbi:MAG: lysylphosphatidylglycerol synthase transmembrane domain-containing protein [Gaiellales bacterium]
MALLALERLPRRVRVAINLVVAGAILAFLIWQIDIRRTAALIADADAALLVGALGIFLVTTVLMAWRWRILLVAKGIAEPLAWLTRLYFVGYAAGQVLPTSLGGDAVRVVEHARRRPDARGEATAAVLVERWLGLVATLVLVAVALVVAVGRYEDIEIFIWIEVAFLVVAVAVAVVFFSGHSGTVLRRLGRVARMRRVSDALGSLQRALHGYRGHRGALAGVLLVTLGISRMAVVKT